MTTTSNEFETNLKIYERKIDFLKYENDHIHVELKAMKLSLFALISDLKLEQIRAQLSGFCVEALKTLSWWTTRTFSQ